jgi:hypothetical protein
MQQERQKLQSKMQTTIRSQCSRPESLPRVSPPVAASEVGATYMEVEWDLENEGILSKELMELIRQQDLQLEYEKHVQRAQNSGRHVKSSSSTASKYSVIHT